jgi:hypothetical protein
MRIPDELRAKLRDAVTTLDEGGDD